MQDYRLKRTIAEDGSIVLKSLPFRPGERVEIIVRQIGGKAGKPYSSRGGTSESSDPFGGVAGEGWDSLGEGSRRGSVSADY